MDAARRLFAAEGYHAVSMRRIADAIEYSPTAIYVYFKDKESLVRELCTEDFGRLASQFVRLAHEKDPIERIRQAGHLYIRFAVEHPNHYKLMFMTEHGPMDDREQAMKGHGDPEQDAYAFLHHSVREAMAAGRFRPELKDAQLVAQTFWAVVHGVASLQITKANELALMGWATLEARAECAIETSIIGMTQGKSPAKPKKTRKSSRKTTGAS
jgi:AcrR family transcriptional regulator